MAKDDAGSANIATACKEFLTRSQNPNAVHCAGMVDGCGHQWQVAP